MKTIPWTTHLIENNHVKPHWQIRQGKKEIGVVYRDENDKQTAELICMAVNRELKLRNLSDEEYVALVDAILKEDCDGDEIDEAKMMTRMDV